MKKKIILYLLCSGLFTFIICKFNIFWMLFNHLDSIGINGEMSFFVTLLTFIFIQVAAVFLGYIIFRQDFKCKDELKRFFAISVYCIAISLSLFTTYDCYFEKMYCITQPIPVYLTEDMTNSIEVSREEFPEHIETDGMRGDVLIVNQNNSHWEEYIDIFCIKDDSIVEIYIPKIYLRSYSYVL